MIRFQVETFHKAEHGQEAFYAGRLDVTLQEADWSVTMLQLSNMVRGLQSMFAGDVVRLTIKDPDERYGSIDYVWCARVQRIDDGLHQIANEIERRA